MLQTHKEDRYEAEQITLRKELKRGYPAMVAYTHSKARSNESLDFNIDNFTTGTQQGGPLQWDAPNQVTSWGSYPLPSIWKFRKFDFSYSLLYRTGFPFHYGERFWAACERHRQIPLPRVPLIQSGD